MNLEFKRVIIFCKSVPMLMEFYSGIIGNADSYIDKDLKWGELKTGSTSLAFHYSHLSSKSSPKFKLVFFSRRVSAQRNKLLKKGIKMGEVKSSGKLKMCNGRDPEGNVFQISNRE